MSIELSSRFVEQDYCRLCLSGIYELHELFPKGPNESNLVLMSKISLLAEIILIPTEEINARICSRCIQQLEDFDSFRRRCKDSDSQIRKIRTFQQWKQNEPPPPSTSLPPSGIMVASKNTLSVTANGQQPPEQAKFGGIFDLMLYGECFPTTAAAEEFCMLFDGCVYRKKSLLVWRCELPNCPCQLLVENNFSTCWIYGKHNHEKLANNQRKYIRMDQRICAFLSKLRDQMDGISDKVQEHMAGSAGVLPQNLGSETPQTAPSNSKSTEIQYSTEGDKPSIFANSHRYYKEAVNSDVSPPQICWRCSDKNCLGMLITTTDLRSYRMHKDHNHAPPKPVNEGLTIRMDFPVKVAALPMNHTPQPAESPMVEHRSPISGIQIISTTPSQPTTLPASSPSLNKTSDKQNVFEMPTSKTGPNEASTSACSNTTNKSMPAVTFYKDSRNYYLYHSQFLYQKETLCSSPPVNGEVMWKCMVATCPSKLTVFPSYKHASGLGHNHGPLNIPLHNMMKVSATEALAKPTIVSEISFYSCSTHQGIYMLHKQFIYDLFAFQRSPMEAILWNCRNTGCEGQVRSGMRFEYLTTVRNHNHGPVVTAVNVEGYLNADQALKLLQEKSAKMRMPNPSQQVQVRINKQIAGEKRTKRCQNDLKQRRKSTVC